MVVVFHPDSKVLLYHILLYMFSHVMEQKEFWSYADDSSLWLSFMCATPEGLK